jgi:N-acyl-D-amino-acid deacylase
MKALLDRELARGAFGMSLGLIYPPSAFARQEELTELAGVLAGRGGLLTVHMRNEGSRVFEAVEEMLEIARLSGVHLQISHLKLMGRPQWGRGAELLAKIRQAREQGVKVTCDQYPYTATSTGLSALVPQWAHGGGFAKMTEHLATGDKGLLRNIAGEINNRGGPQAVLVSSSHGRMKEAEGKTLAELAAMLKLSPEEAAAEVLIRCEGGAGAIYFSLDESDVITILRDMNIAIASDGYAWSFDRKLTSINPHPRSFGTFPRFLQINREKRLMPLEDAVYKITGLPAAILGLPDRGVLKEGNIADITVFDAARVEDRSRYTDSPVKPAGIEHVIVGGRFALRQGRQTGERRGQALRKNTKGKPFL